MSSSTPQPPLLPGMIQTYLTTLAHRLNDASSKSSLPLICTGGFLAEMLWHSQIETRVLKTPPVQVRRAARRAMVFWPALFLGTSAALWWAEGRVQWEQKQRAEERERAARRTGDAEGEGGWSR